MEFVVKEWETIQYCVRSVRNGITKECSKVKGKLGSNINFQCPKCSEPQAAIGTKKDKKSMVLDQNVEFEFVDRFCYLGDMVIDLVLEVELSCHLK